ncbi:hypothetical protein A2U01_0061466, partial [Trifolium medium]|nr:hypothetical protein [Trifolium medium]
SEFQGHWRALASTGDYLAQRAIPSLSDQAQKLKLRLRILASPSPQPSQPTYKSSKQPIPSTYIMENKDW